MCGIFFSIGFENLPPSVIDSVAHRGPDGRGWNEFNSPNGPVVMGHRRLAIVDLSADGHQPMSTEDQRYWVTYNGEIYNYIEIRKELESLGHHFKTKTDTEVLLKSYLEWGADCLNRFNGMFAFVIWDDKEKKVFAARDRFGVKPLYYYRQGNKIAFASEIKQLLSIPEYVLLIDQDHLSFFLLFRHHPLSNSTLFQKIYHLEAGHVFTEKKHGYAAEVWYKPQYSKEGGNLEEKFLALFQDSVKKRLIADVPVGALLSGGLDSSSIVCMISELSKKNSAYKDVETFTSWSPDLLVDERFYSNAVAEKTGLYNHLCEIKDESLQSDIEKIIYHQEEPIFSASIQSEWNIYKNISQKTKLKVVLDGQGSDELTGGYLFMIPYFLSHYLKNGSIFSALKEFYSSLRVHKNLKGKTLAMDTLLQICPEIISCIQSARGKNSDFSGLKNFDNFQDYTIYLLKRSIEPQLRWQDRSSMAFSIESRQPFLDYRLVEFLISLPPEKKFQKGNTKVIIREAMKGILPEIVRNRVTKFGFPSPQETLINNLDQDYLSYYLAKGNAIIENMNIDFFDRAHDSNQNVLASFSLGLWAEQFKVS
ncbi:MAG: asparagine synthase (glutamine-hydrolyzing) [Alphaproteobacteria bacterium]